MGSPASLGIDTKFSRAQLKDIAAWIRDDLDKLVARRGPDSLRPDDVLTLHDIFVAFRKSTTITVSDLRASGIHKAVKLISDGVSRWPTRLCIECDKVIAVWTVRFGEFSEVRPFLHGRGGRLEGIANATEFSRQALLGRWTKLSPEKIGYSISHVHGDLNFKAGAWWINSLFAHHAGIIGGESIDGGTTFDDHGAYAVVIKEENEVATLPDGGLRYRTALSDKGRFRLTAATPKSREPIRVLRSHNNNGIWGPKAGIRYDGLYVVRGWSIRLAKVEDALSGHLEQEGGISYEIVLKRRDPVPFEEVLKRPTNADLDDYMEYNRLRRHHYESRHESLVGNVVKFPPHLPVRDAPPIRPNSVATPSSDSRMSILGAMVGPSASDMTLTQPAFNLSTRRKKTGAAEAYSTVSPRTSLAPGDFPFAASDNSSSESIAQPGPRLHVQEHIQARSTTDPRPNMSKLVEIIPWIDLELNPESSSPTERSSQSGKGGILDTLSSTESQPPPKRVAIDDSSLSLTRTRREPLKRDWIKIKTISLHGRSGSHKKTLSLRDPPGSSKNSNTSSLNTELTRSTSAEQPSRFFPSHSPRAIASNTRLIPMRSMSSIKSYRSHESDDARMESFHGGGDSTHDSDGYFSLPIRDAPACSSTSTPKRIHEASFDGLSGIVRTDPPDSSITTSAKTRGSPQGPHRARSSSEPLKYFITQARPAAPVGSPTSTSVIWRGKESRTSENVGDVSYTEEDVGGVCRDSQIVFTDPFIINRPRRVLRRRSSGVAPDLVG